jgi:hypothetical protein
MSTIGIFTINHPDGTLPTGFIEHTINPFLHDINSDLPAGWSVEIASGWHTLPFDTPEVIEERNRAKALRTAFTLTLSEFPDDLSNEWILDAVANDDERILVWSPFANWDKDELVGYIEQTADAIYDTFHQPTNRP